MSSESILVGYDNLMRKLLCDDCDDEFLQFGVNQEDCREKWLACERELERIKQQIAEAEHLKCKLEARNHHIHGLLQGEVRSRVKKQQEKKDMEEKLSMIRNALSDDDISPNAAEKLKPFLSQNINRRSSFVSQERLETIDEMASVSSSYIQEENMSEEELELSGVVRSYRDIKRNLTPLFEAPTCKVSDENAEKEPQEDFNGQSAGSEELIVATTTTLVRSPEGILKATSVINTNPKLDGKYEISEGRCHSFKKQVVLHNTSCRSCGQRMRFGSTILKCVECGEACHASCEKKMPYCTSILTGDASKKKKMVTFFSSVSDTDSQ